MFVRAATTFGVISQKIKKIGAVIIVPSKASVPHSGIKEERAPWKYWMVGESTEREIELEIKVDRAMFTISLVTRIVLRTPPGSFESFFRYL